MRLKCLVVALISLFTLQASIGTDQSILSVASEIPSSPPLTAMNGMGGFLLKSPPTILPYEIDQKIDNLSMEMNWRRKNNTTGAWSLGFDHKNNQTILTLQFTQKLPSKLTNEEAQKLIKTTEDGQDLWTYAYGLSSQILDIKPQMPPSLEASMGMVGDLLVVKEEVRHPLSITVTDLAIQIKDKVVVFYTGAGISAGIVPTMLEIMKELGMNVDLGEGKVALTLIKKVLADPDSYIAPDGCVLSGLLLRRTNRPILL